MNRDILASMDDAPRKKASPEQVAHLFRDLKEMYRDGMITVTEFTITDPAYQPKPKPVEEKPEEA